MAKQMISNYSFSTSAKTITLTDFSTIRLDRIELIVDTTTNKILYNFADSSVASATVATNVMTLSALQGGENNTDKLAIFYDVLTGDPTYDTPPLANNAAKETGGNLATINTNTAPLLVSSAGGFIRQDSTATIAKESGGNLATLAGAVSSSVMQDNIKQINGQTAANSQLTGSLAVGGGAATNTALTSTTYPLLMAGSDYGGTAKIQNWKVDNSGLGYVSVNNAFALDATLTGGSLQAQGNIASGATDSGNPIKIGGRYNSTPPTLTNGQRGDLSLGTRGAAHVNIIDTNGTTSSTVIGSQSDSLSNSNPGLVVYNYNSVYDGSNWERMRTASILSNGTSLSASPAVGNFIYNGSNWDKQAGNQDNITLLASAAISSNSNSTDQTNYNARGIRIWITTGSFGASESTMVVTLQGKDPVSGNYFTIASTGSLTASGTFQIVCYPGASNSVISSPSVIVGDVLPRTWRVNYTASNWGTGGSTLGIAASLIV